MHTSISLPCTLKKCKHSDTSCRGSNNCYIWALDFNELAQKVEIIETGCSKSKDDSAGQTNSNINISETEKMDQHHEHLLSETVKQEENLSPLKQSTANQQKTNEGSRGNEDASSVLEKNDEN